MKSIYDTILTEIQKMQKDSLTKITMDELYAIAAGHNRKKEYAIRYDTDLNTEFKLAINRLFEEEILFPRKDRKVSQYWMYKNLWIAKKQAEYDSQEYSKTLMKYADEFNMTYYNKRYKEFQEDKKYIDILYDYIKRHDKNSYTSNELGYFLFKDEKSFDQSEKKIGKILNNIGIDLKKLNSYETIEPFFCLTKKSFFEKKERKILIIENKDTYFSLIHMSDQLEKYRDIINLDYDMFIYGEGQKINKSFEHASMHHISKDDTIKYFGDIDPAGFAIYATFRERYKKYNISMANDMYTLMLNNYMIEDLSEIRNNQDKYNNDVVAKIVKQEFIPRYERKIMNIVNSNKYIPQEAIGLIL